MINSEEIKEKAFKQFPNYLSSILQETTIFPLVIKGDKGVKLSLFKRLEGMKNLYNNSRDVLGFGYALETISMNTKHEGVQTFISNIIFYTDTDYLKFIGMEDAVSKFIINTNKLRVYQLESLIITNPMLFINNQDIIDDSIKVLDYFINNSVSDFYIRELPIDVHTKFIENNSSFLSTLLDQVLLDKGKTDSEEKEFSKRYGLKVDDNFYIYIRSLDKNLKLNGFSELVLPYREIKNLHSEPQNVYIVENRTNYLLFRSVSDSVVIWGQGKAVTRLQGIDFIKRSNIYYWGDIDPTGYEILSSLRQFYPQVESIYMDFETLNAYRDLVINITGFKMIELNFLTPQENEIYKSLFCDGYQLRLEQENVRQ